MRKIAADSRALRHLAEQLIEEIAGDEAFPEGEREDLATSLVRQWVSYDGHATLFLGGRQVYLVLGQTPLGRPCVVPLAAPGRWLKQLTGEWKVSADDLPEALDRLNRGQSAEVVNADGVPLRLWVNPWEKTRGVEPLAGAGARPGMKRDYRQLAAAELVGQFGRSLGPDEMDELARSVARQWRRHEGHACLFVGGHQQLVLRLNENADGTGEVVSRKEAVDLEAALTSFGFPPEALPQLIGDQSPPGDRLPGPAGGSLLALVRPEGGKDRGSAGRSRAAGGAAPDAASPLPELHGGLAAVAGRGAARELRSLRPYDLAPRSAGGGAPDAVGALPPLHGGHESLAGGAAAADLPTLRL